MQLQSFAEVLLQPVSAHASLQAYIHMPSDMKAWASQAQNSQSLQSWLLQKESTALCNNCF